MQNRPPPASSGQLAGEGPGAALARRLRPAALIAPAILGLVWLEGYRLGLYDPSTGVFLFALAMPAALTVVVHFIARSVDEDVAERTGAREELKANEARFRALATQSPGGVYEVDLDGILTFGNERWCEMAGLPGNDIGTVAYMDLVHPDDRGQIQATWERSVDTGKPFEMEYRLLRPDGGVTWVSGRATTVLDSDGRPAGYFGAGLDITGRRMIEAELRLQGQMTEHMAEGVILVRHSDDRIVHANRRFEEIFGYGPGELEGMSVSCVNAPTAGDPMDVATEIQSAVAEYGSWIGQIHNMRKDGSEFWTQASVSMFEHPEHGLVSVSVQEDITERKRADDALRNERRLLRESQEIGQVGSWEWDLAGGLTTWSDHQFRLYGLEPAHAAPQGADFMALVHPDDRERVAESMEGLRVTPGDFESEHRVVHPSGEIRTLLVQGAVAPGDGNRLAGTTRDVTGEREAREAVHTAEERFRGAFENAPIGMAVVSLDGDFVEVNDALCEIVGHAREDLEGSSFDSITHPDDLERAHEEMLAMLSDTTSSRQLERRYLHANGHPVWVQLNGTLVRDASGGPRHFLIQVQDVTDRRRYEEQLQHMADHDPLTGLLNRRSFERELQRHVANVQRYGVQGAALVLDLDNFKYYNDTLGHHVGDDLIVHVAGVLKQRLRDSDVLARLGGDEFAVILPKEDVDGAHLVAKALLDCVREEGARVDAGRGKPITASVGVAMFDGETGLTGEDVLVNADLAMYDAKEAGRDRFAHYSAEDHSQARMKGRIKWVDRIRTALDDDGFVLLAQPIVDLGGGGTDRYELLIRMEGEDGDLIPPGTFLYIAERLGWINAIDRWVSRRAIEILAEQRDLGRDIHLEVNLSGLSIGDDELLQVVEEGLRDTGVEPSRLTFEITETAAVANITEARTFAERLCDLGCQFALDDFGAGFGSFYYLKHLPFDFLKIDGEFVKGCVDSKTDRLLIEAVVGIARGMGKRTVAEFVGDDETVRTLRRLGVELGQGFHLGRPAPLEELLGAATARQ